MKPSEFAGLPVKEKALIIAFIDEYQKDKKKESDAIERASRKAKSSKR